MSACKKEAGDSTPPPPVGPKKATAGEPQWTEIKPTNGLWKASLPGPVLNKKDETSDSQEELFVTEIEGGG